MSDIKLKNFLNPEAMEKVKEKNKADLEEEKQQYFSELDILFEMMWEKKLMPFEQFSMLYNDICDNLNRVMEVERVS